MPGERFWTPLSQARPVLSSSITTISRWCACDLSNLCSSRFPRTPPKEAWRKLKEIPHENPQWEWTQDTPKGVSNPAERVRKEPQRHPTRCPQRNPRGDFSRGPRGTASRAILRGIEKEILGGLCPTETPRWPSCRIYALRGFPVTKKCCCLHSISNILKKMIKLQIVIREKYNNKAVKFLNSNTQDRFVLLEVFRILSNRFRLHWALTTLLKFERKKGKYATRSATSDRMNELIVTYYMLVQISKYCCHKLHFVPQPRKLVLAPSSSNW